MCSWGAEAVTSLVKAALAYKYETPLHENLKLQSAILAPLRALSSIAYNDIRQKQLESVSHVLQNNGDSLLHGWPLVLEVIGAVIQEHGEKLIQMAFQCLQLVVTDFLPIIRAAYCQVVVQVAAKFGLQQQELNVSLTAIGLLVSQWWYFLSLLESVLFPLLENVQKFSSSASTIRDKESTGNILIHHSRDTAEKQWAETRVLTLAGVARTFNAKRKMLQGLGDFPRAWSLLLEHIELSALCQNAEVSLAALKSFQEILQIGRATKGSEDGESTGPSLIEPPSSEVMNRTGDAAGAATGKKANNELCSKGPISDSADHDIPLWSAAWKVWLNIGTEVTKPPSSQNEERPTGGAPSPRVYLPSQNFLTALIQTFPPLFEHIKSRFVAADLHKLSAVLKGTLCVPVQSDASPFIVPSYTEATVTPLQEASLAAMEALIKAVQSGPDNMQATFPDIFQQLLTFISFGVHAPKFGDLEAKTFGVVRGPQVRMIDCDAVL
ncbi:protein MON2 homolog [Aplysia californica]|uniref:Protein MON2 homolog n=1 Tax=Aplysia californica TaxID=6500 RepID=A0ABM1VXM7_APLCA|nr:protein MON2 homolog [Aplysia californica]